jgi:L-lactate permease
MVGLVVLTLTLRAGSFLPDGGWDFGHRSGWPDHGVGPIEPGEIVGGAIANLLAIHHVVPALAVVGFLGEEGRVIRRVLMLLYYGVATGIVTLLLAYVLVPGAF